MNILVQKYWKLSLTTTRSIFLNRIFVPCCLFTVRVCLLHIEDKFGTVTCIFFWQVYVYMLWSHKHVLCTILCTSMCSLKLKGQTLCLERVQVLPQEEYATSVSRRVQGCGSRDMLWKWNKIYCRRFMSDIRRVCAWWLDKILDPLDTWCAWYSQDVVFHIEIDTSLVAFWCDSDRFVLLLLLEVVELLISIDSAIRRAIQQNSNHNVYTEAQSNICIHSID